MRSDHDVNINRSWKESALMDDFEGFNSSVEEVTAYWQKQHENQNQKPEDVTKLLPSHDKTVTNKELLLMNDPKKQFLEKESTSGEDTFKLLK